MEETVARCKNDQNQGHGFNAWWKRNWKKVIAGVVIVGGTIFVIKGWDELMALYEKLAGTLSSDAKFPAPPTVPKAVEEYEVPPVKELVNEAFRKSPETPFDVTAHIRNLPEGWHASSEKLAKAAQLQIVLLPNQTYVDPYTKGRKVA